MDFVVLKQGMSPTENNRVTDSLVVARFYDYVSRLNCLIAFTNKEKSKASFFYLDHAKKYYQEKLLPLENGESLKS